MSNIEKITQDEINANSMAGVSNRPGDVTGFGASGMTPAQLKARFSALALLAIYKCNELIDALGNDAAESDLLSLLYTPFADALDDTKKMTLSDFLQKVAEDVSTAADKADDAKATAEGMTITGIEVDENYNLQMTLGDGTVLTTSDRVVGQAGATGIRGPQGVSVTGAEIDPDTHYLTLTLSNGNSITINVSLKGDKGDQGLRGLKGEKGDPFQISAVYASISAMRAAEATDGVPVGGFAIINTDDVEDADNAKLYVKTSATAYGENPVADLSGATGIQGPAGQDGNDGADGEDGADGVDGDSAYDIAVSHGFEGTEEEWLASLVGATGATGATGNGIASITLADVAGEVRTYTITFTNGNTTTFTVTDGMNGVNGRGIASISKTGTSLNVDTYTITYTDNTTSTFTVTNGVDGSDGQDGQDGSDGADGVSIIGASIDSSTHYLTLFLSNGNSITISTSLKGAKGDNGDDGADGNDGADGKSAFEIAQEHGFQGTEAEWLESLRGTPFQIRAIYASVAAMQAAADSDSVPLGGFAIINTGNVQDADNAKLYVKVVGSNSQSTYSYLTDLSGAQGIQGPAGQNGTNGTNGTNGQDGSDGDDGKSAYELACDNGFTGTVAQWLASLKGDPGQNGKGISSISKTGTSGNVDTYTITYTDNTTSTFTVTNGVNGSNGSNGTNGKGIYSISKTGTSGNVDTYTITYTDNTTSTFTVTNGTNGTQVTSGGNALSSFDADSKLDKVSTPDSYERLYGIAADGTQKEVNLSTGANAGHVVQRKSDGNITAGIPQAQSDATSKEYVDNAIQSMSGGGGLTWHAVNANYFTIQSDTLEKKLFIVLFHGDGSSDNYDTSTVIVPDVTWALEIKGTMTAQGKYVSAYVSEMQDPDLGTYYNISVYAPQYLTIDGYFAPD